MTTPQTPAGWYSDPDGSGGQRYWDGFTWTEHRAPAPQQPPPPPPPPPPFVPPVPSSTSARGGSHRAPDPETGPVEVPEPAAQPTEAIRLPASTAGAVEDSTWGSAAADPAPAGATEVFATSPHSEATSVIPTMPPPPPDPGPPGSGRGLLVRYLALCAALLAVLVAVAVYAVFFVTSGGPTTVSASSDTTTSQTAAPTTTADETLTETPTETATAAPTPTESGDPTDGAFAYSVHGVEIGTTVTSADAPIEKTAVGEYVVVHLTVTNIGDAPTPFLGTFQKLLAGGTVYSIDDEATFYLGGGMTQLEPGQQADLSVAFDVPPGTTPEAIELHTEPLDPGIQVPLS